MTAPKRMVAFVALAVGAALAGGALTRPAAQAAEVTCADVVIIGARGSGQPQAGYAEDGNTGLGPQVFLAARRVAGALPGRSVAIAAAQYPASPTQLLSSDLTAYFRGLETGVAWTRQTLNDRAAACPNERVVLMGYSQGAMVMHRVTQDLIAERSATNASILARLDGALLLADGDRDSTDGIRRYGTSKRGYGMARQFAGLSGARSTPIPRLLRPRLHSVCDLGDSVCNFTGIAALSSDVAQQVHVTHYRDSRPVRKADRRIVRQLKAALALSGRAGS